MAKPAAGKRKGSMIKKQIPQGSLLYHAVHGLCRVNRLIKQDHSGEEVLCYSLEPKNANKMRVRFLIPVSDMDASGFHKLVSEKEANEILDYLKDGDDSDTNDEPEAASSLAEGHRAWGLARKVRLFSTQSLELRDQRKRQMLERSMKGLVGELAIVFDISCREAAEKVGKSLGKSSKTNPWLVTALAHAGEE